MDSTLGLGSYTKRTSPWYQKEGRDEFLRLLRICVARLSPSDAHLESQVMWDDEVSAKLASVQLDPAAPLRPTPQTILEAVTTLADVFLQRHLMRKRLGAMRSKTSVALVPRAQRDDAARGKELLLPVIQQNTKYSQYLSRVQPGPAPAVLETSAACFWDK
jgi:hypothetical protein